MLTAKTRRDITDAIALAGNVCHPIHVTNAAQTHTVAIRGYGPSVTFDDRFYFVIGEQVKWYDRLLGESREAIEDIADWLLEPEMVEGRHFKLWINQANRDCWVERLTPTRVRISFEMPTCTQGGWRKTRDLFGRRFITC